MMIRQSLFAFLATWPLAVSGSAEASASQASVYAIRNAANSKQIEEAVVTFNQGLKRLSSDTRIEKCKYTFTHLIGNREQNVVYGAVCRLTNNRDVLLCSDRMIGDFALSASFSETSATVADFMQSNCPGG